MLTVLTADGHHRRLPLRQCYNYVPKLVRRYMQALYYWAVNRTGSFRLGLAFQDQLTVNRLTDNIPSHLPYRITECYLLPDTSERAPP